MLLNAYHIYRMTTRELPNSSSARKRLLLAPETLLV